MSVSRSDTLNEELAMILMDVFSILASVGFIMVLLIIVISDYNPPPPGLTVLNFNPPQLVENSVEFKPVRDNITKSVFEDLNINSNRPGIEVKKTATLSFDARALADSAAGSGFDFSKSLGSISFFDAAIKENGNIQFMRLIFCPELLIEGQLYDQCLVSIPLNQILPGTGEHQGLWLTPDPTINIYNQDSSGRYSYLMDIIKADYPKVEDYLFKNFLESLNNRGDK